MKKLIFLAINFFVSTAMAQGTLQVSNLGQTPTVSTPVASDAWVAQQFDILPSDPNSYILTSVQLLMNSAAGSPSGFSVAIYDSLGPADDLGNLTGSAPAAGGVFTYTTPGITLSPDATYFVVVTAATPSAAGTYSWSGASPRITQTGTWYINDAYGVSSDGVNWTGYVRQAAFQMALYATPVPEPSTWALAGIGALVLGLRRRKQNVA